MDNQTAQFILRLLDLCDEALTCAGEYAGRDSETLTALNERFNKISEEFFNMPR